MKTLAALALILSLAVNAVVVWCLLVPAGGATQTAVLEPMPLTAEPGKLALTPAVWASLQPDDLPSLVSRLRASGFPDDVVRAVVAGQMAEQYRVRMNALRRGSETAYWKSGTLDPAVILEMSRLGREQAKALEALLGPDPESLQAMFPPLTFLSAEKAAEVRRIQRDYDELRMELHAATSGLGFDREKYAALEREHRAALKQVLTPDELLDYDLRNSSTSHTMRSNLAMFKPTEEEFRAIFQLQQAFDERFNPMYGNPMVGDAGRARRDAQEQLMADIKAVLTPERAAAYEKMSDSTYVRTAQLVERLELPPETTDAVMAVQKELQDFMKNRGRNQPGADIRTFLDQYNAKKQEALERVTTLLGGQRGLEAYRQNGGYWVQSLTATPRPSGSVRAGSSTSTVIGKP